MFSYLSSKPNPCAELSQNLVAVQAPSLSALGPGKKKILGWWRYAEPTATISNPFSIKAATLVFAGG
jgi:hypothetical protein